MRDFPDRTWSDPQTCLRGTRPDHPVGFFCPATLRATARRFQQGFPGLVTYAVKANPAPQVLATLADAGIDAFDVASPAEMVAVRAHCPDAALHYNNPVRSADEVAFAVRMGVASCSVDCGGELDKLIAGGLAKGTEVAVRLALPVTGAAYDFGAKFGAGPDVAAALLRRVAAAGFVPAMTFHPGTQCADPAAWAAYIRASGDVARASGVRLARLNVGGGFAAHRSGPAPDLEAIFARIGAETARAFGAAAPALVCEPGRAMVGDAVTVALRVKALRDGGAVFLNDGLYGALAEWRDIALPDRITVIAPDGPPRQGAPAPREVFGPTCDSLDKLPGAVPLPDDLAEGDYLLIAGMGAYCQSLVTAFNGYGLSDMVCVARC